MSKKNTISIQVSLDPEELAEDLLNAGGFDITKFILHLDEMISDEGFTLELVTKLLKGLMVDYESRVEYLAKQALEQSFGANPPAPWPSPSHPIHMRDYAKEWEEEEEWHNILKDTLKGMDKLLSKFVV